MDLYFLTLLLFGINIISFLLFGIDKWLAKNKKYRISEKNLLVISFLGGSIGSILGIVLFKHKTSKPQFIRKFIIVFLIQIVTIFIFTKIYKL